MDLYGWLGPLISALTNIFSILTTYTTIFDSTHLYSYQRLCGSWYTLPICSNCPDLVVAIDQLVSIKLPEFLVALMMLLGTSIGFRYLSFSDAFYLLYPYQHPSIKLFCNSICIYSIYSIRSNCLPVFGMFGLLVDEIGIPNFWVYTQKCIFLL